MNNVKLPFYAHLALALLAIVTIIFMLCVGSSLFIPLVFAFLISVLLFPLCRFMEQRLHFPRSLAAMLSVLLFIALIGVFVYFFTLQIISFSEDLPKLHERLQVILKNVQSWIAHEYHVNSTQQIAYLNKSLSGILSIAANSLGNIFMGIGTVAIWTIFMFIYTYFMLFHRGLLQRFVLHLFSPRHRAQVHEVVLETKGMINSYVLGLLTEMVILSIVNSGMFALFGIQYALLLGIMAAVLNIVPYLGIYTSMAIGMLVTFANSDGNKALEVGIILLCVHFVDANILMPRIVGSRVKMNPLVTIIAVLIGHFIWGIPGMFLFIPIVGIIKIISERVEGLQPWAILIGTEEKPKKKKAPKIDLNNPN